MAVRQLSDGGPDGSTFGQSASDKIALHGATPVIQASAITSPTGGATVDAESRTAVTAILVALRNKGIIAT
jgi:hypothetical protein